MKKDITRTLARLIMVAALVAIAIGYASAFQQGGAPSWAPWLLAIGIPASLGAIMALGAARGDRGLGRLKLPLVFVFVLLAAGFCLALALPATEVKGATLLLGLPLRAAIMIYGIGLAPIFILPVVYATTFETQTLSDEDIAKVRQLAAERAE
jgi:hypothetical protein